MKNIAILCSGGDVSGMNAALKRFVEYSISKGLTPYFVENGYILHSLPLNKYQ